MPFDVEPLRRQLRRQLNQFADLAADEMTRQVEQAAPVDKGELARSVTHDSPKVSDNRTEITVRTGDLVQAETTEHGARPHVIRPRTKQALKFQIGGKTVIVRKVNHPGNPPMPWFYPTLEKWPQVAERVWRRVSR